MRHFNRILILTALLLSFGGAHAQPLYRQPGATVASTTISYQGALSRDDGAALPDGVYPMTFRLYGDEEGKRIVWQASYSISVVGGSFNVLLGSSDQPLPTPSSMDQPLWLGLQVAEQPEMKPLSALSATPFAINVANDAISSAKIKDGAVTAEKLSADYVSDVIVDGVRVTGRAAPLSLKSSDDVRFLYDPVSGAVEASLVDPTRASSLTGGKSGETLADLTVNGKFTVIGNTVLGNSTSHTITFNAKAANSLMMDLNSLREVNILELGRSNAQKGYLDFLNTNNTKRLRVQSVNTTNDRIYVIPDVGTHASFLMNAGDQELLGSLHLSGSVIPVYDNITQLGSPDQRVADLYVGTGSLHLASTSEETVVSRDWSSGIIVEDSTAQSSLVGAYQVKEGGVALMTISPNTGDMNLTGEISTSGLKSSGDIQLGSDDVYSIGSPDTRLADLYLGTGSLHLASTSEETIVSRDWSTGIIVADSTDGSSLIGAYQVKEGGVALLTLEPTTGDLSVNGTMESLGLTTSGDIQMKQDDVYTIGTPQERVADIYVGTGSVHWISTEAETVTPTDWSFGVALEETPQGTMPGSFILREGETILQSITPDGSLHTSGKVHSAQTLSSDASSTLITKGYADALGVGLQTDLSGVEGDLTAVTARVATNEDDIDDIGQTVANHTISLAAHVTALESHAATLEEQTSSINAHAEELSSLTSGLEELEGDVGEVVNDLSGLEGRVGAAEYSISQHDETLAEHTSSLSSTLSSLDGLQEAIEEFDGTLTDHSSALTSISSSLSELAEASDVMADDITALDGRVATLEENAEEVGSTLSTHTEAIEALDGAVVANADAIADLEDALSNLDLSDLSSLAGIVEDIEGLDERMSAAEETIEGFASTVAGLATTAYVDQSVAGVAQHVFRNVVTRDIGPIASNSSVIETFTVQGAQVGDGALVSPGSALDNALVIAYARVSAANTVEVKIRNSMSSSRDPANMNWTIVVFR